MLDHMKKRKELKNQSKGREKAPIMYSSPEDDRRKNPDLKNLIKTYFETAPFLGIAFIS